MTATVMNAEALASAFEAFNRQAGTLEASYRELQAQVRSLAAELQAERSARQREWRAKQQVDRRLAGLLELLPGGLLVLDGAGIIREHNGKALEMLNRPLAGCPWSDIVRREFRPGKRADGELELRDGRRLSLARRPLEHEAGEILLLSDVTESRRMSDLLHRSERLSLIGEMTAKLAHQIRTPLTAALLHSSRLERREPEAAGKISAKLQELALMVDDMLRYASGARQTGETFAVTDLFRDVIDEIAPRLPAGLVLASEMCRPDLCVRGNRAALKGALSNLVSNAMEACGNAGRIELSALIVDGRVCLTVTDDGPGIAADVRARLFEPFFTTRPQGTGLGLAVVRSVAEAHDGQVHVHSSGAGTLFSISLPDLVRREAGNE